MSLKGIGVAAVTILAFVAGVIGLRSLGLSAQKINWLLMLVSAVVILWFLYFSAYARSLAVRFPTTPRTILWVCRHAGTGLIWLGAIVALGNRTGAMPTAPYAGTALIVLGAGLFSGSLAASRKP